ncbi:MAG: carboxypeptidase regulatory-like domain-containing protein, partial [Bacteroidetes bacterium]|nr:carboxypeptidase regulatory-like domain-containing protein [Bacteroidota bacterium]
EKLHRPKFVIRNPEGSLVSGAQIEIQDTILWAGKGVVTYAFASPGQFFLVKVIPPENSNYTVWYEEVEIPISPNYHTIEIKLRNGKEIQGVVTAGPDSLPLAGARVFVKGALKWNNDFPIAEAITNENGEYTLKGIPIDTVYTAVANPGQNNGILYPVEIHAVKSDPQISYVGDKKSANMNSDDPVNLHLDIIEGINLTQIWGLPIEVEDFKANSNGGGKLTGAFVNLPENENFAIQDPNVRISFYNIDVIPGSKYDAQGVPSARPVADEIVTDQTSLLVDVYDHFTGKMYSRDYYTNKKEADRIVVSHDGAEHGLIQGNVGILLSSFNFSYQYSGNFVLADNPEQTITNVFSTQPIAERSYHLVDYKRGSVLKNAAYKVHNFNAHADRNKSYIFRDSVHLFTVLHTNIPDSKPADLKIEAGEIVVLKDNILPFSSGKKLTFHLEDWEVVSLTPWYYNKNQGSIFIQKGMVHTGVIDIPVENIRLQPDDLDIDNPNLQQSGLSLGGVVPLNVSTSNFIFGYDTKCGSDLKPHWKLRLINEGNGPVAMFT